ncbi:N-acetyltransferase [Sphaerisporangium melleum]|uniref:N-acetyltransferase n=1 Tax=Sphaerisporangium melleum TaxID=321316 RepID=A0A917QUX6_9ACTN|nr:GNAT family N-acetyltransferase [Sphaerisporangium melleum]GGK68871.1 N-acetyltransferase [Sphaerisporangium melleum]GII68943.1 N-acetyltransferase [Sphaerisporangium melleum]
MTETVEVADNPAAARFEITVGGTLAGFAEYRQKPGKTVFTHTEIAPEFEGQGLASRLIRDALDATRAAGRAVVPLCPFVARYIERHPEYGDLVAKAASADPAQSAETAGPAAH